MKDSNKLKVTEESILSYHLSEVYRDKALRETQVDLKEALWAISCSLRKYSEVLNNVK